MDVQDEASGELDLAGESFRMKHWLASNHGLAGLTDALSRCVSLGRRMASPGSDHGAQGTAVLS